MFAGRVRVLEADPDLGATLPSDQYEHAMARCTAELSVPGRGAWPPADVGVARVQVFGFLVLRGAVLQRLRVAGRETADLFGPGDVVRPWGPLDAFAELLNPSRWEVMDGAELAVLDRAFLEQAGNFPEIMTALGDRTARHVCSLLSRLAVAQIPRVDTRLRLVLWDLADRFGSVTRDGVLLPLRLRHDVLAGLVSSSREAVSRAVGSLERRGILARGARGWLLLGGPPDELFTVDERRPQPRLATRSTGHDG